MLLISAAIAFVLGLVICHIENRKRIEQDFETTLNDYDRDPELTMARIEGEMIAALIERNELPEEEFGDE